jgi:hypothetical protein
MRDDQRVESWTLLHGDRWTPIGAEGGYVGFGLIVYPFFMAGDPWWALDIDHQARTIIFKKRSGISRLRVRVVSACPWCSHPLPEHWFAMHVDRSHGLVSCAEAECQCEARWAFDGDALPDYMGGQLLTVRGHLRELPERQ